MKRYFSALKGACKLTQLTKYLSIFAILFFICNSGANCKPLSLAFYSACLIGGANVLTTFIVYGLAITYPFDFLTTATLLFAGILIGGVLLLYAKKNRCMRWEIIIYVLIALLPYIFLSPKYNWGTTAIYVILSSLLALPFCFAYNLAFVKRLSAAPHDYQIICLCGAAVISLIGVGRLLGTSAYYAISYYLLLFCTCVLGKRHAVTLSATLSIPLVVIRLSLMPMATYTIVGLMLYLTAEYGK